MRFSFTSMLGIDVGYAGTLPTPFRILGGRRRLKKPFGFEFDELFSTFYCY